MRGANLRRYTFSKLNSAINSGTTRANARMEANRGASCLLYIFKNNLNCAVNLHVFKDFFVVYGTRLKIKSFTSQVRSKKSQHPIFVIAVWNCNFKVHKYRAWMAFKSLDKLYFMLSICFEGKISYDDTKRVITITTFPDRGLWVPFCSNYKHFISKYSLNCGFFKMKFRQLLLAVKYTL